SGNVETTLKERSLIRGLPIRSLQSDRYTLSKQTSEAKNQKVEQAGAVAQHLTSGGLFRRGSVGIEQKGKRTQRQLGADHQTTGRSANGADEACWPDEKDAGLVRRHQTQM